jgi:hypothetical protein
VLAHVYAVRDAPTMDAARAVADRFTTTLARDYPAAVACFTDDLDALLAIHRVPADAPGWPGRTVSEAVEEDHGPDPAAAAQADAIRRDFTTDAARINQRWCGDFTYLATWEGWLYLSVGWNPSAEGAVGRKLSSPAGILT